MPGLNARALEKAKTIPADGLVFDLGDEEGFDYARRLGRELGFDGKELIHPKQVDAANRVFSPSPADIEWSRRVIAAHAEAEKDGKGIVVLDNRLVENLHVEEAKRVMALARTIDELEKAT